MTDSKMMQFLQDTEAKNPKFAEYRKKAIASVATTEEDGDADSIVYRGYIVCADDESLFSTKNEVDEYLSIISKFHKSNE